MLIGRKKEISILNQIIHSKQAEFLAIYGRRRVGKTFLIRNTIEKKGVYLECSGLKDGTLKEQLANFTQKFSNTFYGGAKLQPPSDWRSAFELLTLEIKKFPKTKKIIIFLDELPWLATKRSKLIQNLDYYWNTEWSKLPNLKIITCGSAAAWMLNNLINAKGGLYNRITKSILLEPFSLKETKEFLEHKKIKLSERQIVDLYMIMGGIPFYLNQLENSKSMVENINRLCFEKDGLLQKEFNRLFKSLFESPSKYVEIIKELAKCRYGLPIIELAQKVKTKIGGRFQERLNELEACGFIKKFYPYTKKKRNAYYKVIDEYSLFYLKWIANVVEGERIPGGINYWNTLYNSASWYAWADYSFENLVYKHVNLIIKTLGLEKLSCLVSHWCYRTSSKDKQGAEIDLLLDRNDGAVTLCEIKYSLHPFVIDKTYAKILINKLETFEKQLTQPKQLFLAMITSSGLKKNAWSQELVQSVVTIKNLFN